MVHLDTNIYGQIYHLRTLPQALVTPLAQTLRNKSLPPPDSGLATSLYSKIEKMAVEGARDLDKFKQDWSSDESKALWKRTQTTPYPQGTSIWYTDYAQALKAYKELQKSHVPDKNTIEPDTRDSKDIIDDFRKRHPSIPLQMEADAVPPSELKVAGMLFQISSKDVGGKAEFVVANNSTAKLSELQTTILKQLDRRRAKDNLAYLLVRFTMYQNHSGRPQLTLHRLCSLLMPMLKNALVIDAKF